MMNCKISYIRYGKIRAKNCCGRANGVVCGFAGTASYSQTGKPVYAERDFMDVDEFCVDKEDRRQGIATKMMSFIRNYTKEKGIKRLELNMWEFNQDALAFYEAVGFKTYRRYMEMKV